MQAGSPLQAVHRTYAHLLSGLDLDGGLAWMGKLCESYLPEALKASNQAYGVCTQMGTAFKWEGDQVRSVC